LTKGGHPARYGGRLSSVVDVRMKSFRDSLSLQKSLINWGNKISALRWNYEISNKLFANTTVTYSDYKITTENSEEVFRDSSVIAAFYNSGITDLGAKIDFDFVPSTHHYIKFGASMVKHQYNPGINQNIQRSPDEDAGGTRKVADIQAVETDIYVEDDIKLGKFNANIGVRGSAFAVENKFYTSLQPRLGLRYLATESMSIKASYSTMTQFINLLTSESLSLPPDVWVPSTNRISPQESWQAALGISGSKGQYEWEIEGYYKQMDNVLSYQEGASLFNNNPESWEDQISQGEGESYGMEVLLQKTKGKLTGWIGYTLSWSNRRFDDIEDGGEKNSFRMSPTHRLDWSISFIKKRKKYERTWVIGFYNTYFRKNPFYLDLESKPVFSETLDEFGNNLIGTTNVVTEKSLIPIIPSFSYNIKF